MFTALKLPKGQQLVAGKVWPNIDQALPIVTTNGEPIIYQEYDIEMAPPGERTSLRFLRGDDGTLYMTEDAGCTFYRVIDTPLGVKREVYRREDECKK